MHMNNEGSKQESRGLRVEGTKHHIMSTTSQQQHPSGFTVYPHAIIRQGSTLPSGVTSMCIQVHFVRTSFPVQEALWAKAAAHVARVRCLGDVV